MDLTDSHTRVVPHKTLLKYSWVEVRNAAAVLKASDPDACAELLDVLDRFLRG